MSDEKCSHNINHDEEEERFRAESKTASIQPPRPPCDEKKHWSVTEEGGLVARATAHVYRSIVATQNQGGMKDYLEEKCGLFLDISGEQSLECTLVYQEYEKRIESSLEEFAKSEGKSPVEIMKIIERVSLSHKKAARNLEMLLAATGYEKFSKMMHRRAVEAQKKKIQKEEENNNILRERHSRIRSDNDSRVVDICKEEK